MRFVSLQRSQLRPSAAFRTSRPRPRDGADARPAPRRRLHGAREPESELQEELDDLEQQLNDEYNQLEDDWDDDDDGMETDSDL